MQRGNELVRQKIHPTSIISGYRLARKEAVKYIKVRVWVCRSVSCVVLTRLLGLPQDFLLIPTDKMERDFLVSAAKVPPFFLVFTCRFSVTTRVPVYPPDEHVLQDYWRVVRLFLQPCGGCRHVCAHGISGRQSVLPRQGHQHPEVPRPLLHRE